MIIGHRREGGRIYLLIGLSQGNVERLAAGERIRGPQGRRARRGAPSTLGAERRTHGQAVPEELVLEIHYGVTEDELARRLEQAGILRPETLREDRRTNPKGEQP